MVEPLEVAEEFETELDQYIADWEKSAREHLEFVGNEETESKQTEAAMSDSDLKTAADRTPLALPAHDGVDDKHLTEAWGHISRLWPEMASKVSRIGAYDLATVPAGAKSPGAFINPKTGVLAIKPDTALDAKTLWNELVHLEQYERGDLKPRSQMTADELSAIENEARERSEVAEKLIDRLKKADDVYYFGGEVNDTMTTNAANVTLSSAAGN